MSSTIHNFSINLNANTHFNSILSPESVEILHKFKKINEVYFFWHDDALVKKLELVNPVDLTNILKCFFMEMVQHDSITDPIEFLDRMATVIPFAKMQEAVKDDYGDALQAAKGMFEEAKLYFQMTQKNSSPTIQARITSIIDGINSVIESVITAFGIGDFFKAPENDVQADRKSQKIMMLLHLFTALPLLILPILGAEAGAALIAGVLLAISALSLIWPFVKPTTTHLPANAENWTKQIQNGAWVAQGRKESLDEIADIIKMNRHAILVGPSRVGKSLTAKAFAQAVERGDYPELNGKVVFRINTKDLVGQKASFEGGGNTILNRISAEMGRHRDDIILVFDEIHNACNSKDNIAEQLKTFLDEGGEFPHVIGITTDEEYDAHVKNNTAFSLRFDRVDIKNTEIDETVKILADTLLRSHSKPLISDGALHHIYKTSSQVENAPQPSASLKLLKQCINQTEKTQQSPLKKKIVKVSNKILSLRSQAAASRGRKKETNAKLTDLEKKMGELQETLVKEQKEFDTHFKSKDLLDHVTKATYSSVLKISTLAESTLSPNAEKEVNLFLLLHAFLGRSLESHITEQSKALRVISVIDEALIDKVASA